MRASWIPGSFAVLLSIASCLAPGRATAEPDRLLAAIRSGDGVVQNDEASAFSAFLGRWVGRDADTGTLREVWTFTDAGGTPALRWDWYRGDERVGWAHCRDIRALPNGHLTCVQVMDQRPFPGRWASEHPMTDLRVDGDTLRWTGQYASGAVERAP